MHATHVDNEYNVTGTGKMFTVLVELYSMLDVIKPETMRFER